MSNLVKWGVGSSTLIAIIIIGLIVLFPSPSTKGSTWEKVTTFMYDTKKESAVYNVEVSGWNVRVVEWIPHENPTYRCMFIAGTEKAGSACYPTIKMEVK